MGAEIGYGGGAVVKNDVVGSKGGVGALWGPKTTEL